ncbi:MAG: class I SAM-dependent methyltransferase [Methanoregula sp.]|nr:MAG: class I SAM-dependent methyltransferase [Methanoregula sp.]
MPSKSDLDLYYKTVWTTSEDVGIVYKIQAEERVRYITRHIRLPGDAQILDVGSGHGLLYEAFKEQGFDQIAFFATDPSPENLERLKKRGISGFPDIASIGDRQFDLVTICYVLEHVPDPLPFLSDIISHVKPGGYVFIDLPERDDTFKSLLEPHVVVYTEKSLLALADKTGLSVIHQTGYGQLRDLLIAEQDGIKLVKDIRNFLSGAESRLFTALFPEKSDDFMRKKLFETYRFDEEGPDRWWIRSVMKKK